MRMSTMRSETRDLVCYMLLRARIGTACIRRVQRFDAHTSCADGDHFKAARCFEGNIQNAVAFEGATVIDAHDDGAIVRQVRHFQICSEWECSMSGGQRVHVEALAAGGFAPMVRFAVVGGDTNGRSGRRWSSRDAGRLRTWR